MLYCQHDLAQRVEQLPQSPVARSLATRNWRSCALTVNLTRRDRILDRLRALAINLATNAECGAEDLLHNTLEGLGETLEAHGSCNLDDLVQGNRLAVLDVLLLLAVTRRLLEGTDDQRRGGGDDRDGCLTVLDGELAGYAQTLLFGGKNMFVSFNVPLSLRTFRDRGNSRFDVVCAS